MNLIFLAAGNSTRFGSNKLLYRLNGKCMYRYGLEVVAAEGSGRSVRQLIREEQRMAKTSMKIKQQRPAKFSTREYNRCKICGRPHAYLRKYGVCRICFRE